MNKIDTLSVIADILRKFENETGLTVECHINFCDKDVCEIESSHFWDGGGFLEE